MADQTYFWSDLDDSLNKQADGDVQRDFDVPSIFNSIRNICLTYQGERRMLPTFATNMQSLLFEPIDEVTARLIAENLIAAINVWEDRVEVKGFDIEPRPDDNYYRCRLKFTIYGSEQTESVDFILTR